jgi:hypothetical protein
MSRTNKKILHATNPNVEKLSAEFAKIAFKSNSITSSKKNSKTIYVGDQNEIIVDDQLSDKKSNELTKNSKQSLLPVSNGRLASSSSRSESRQSNLNHSQSMAADCMCLVPTEVSLVHNSHLISCPNMQTNQPTTPGSESTISNCTLASVESKISKKSAKQMPFRFEEYMPLCEVQRLLAKGQVVEVSISP